jgi:hypothetical protein
VLVLVALVAAAPAHGAARDARTTFCKPRHSKTLGRAHGVRLVLVAHPARADEYGEPVTLYACFPNSRRRVVLESFPSTVRWTPGIVRITPRYAAYAATGHGVACEKYGGADCVRSAVTVRTLRTGRRRCLDSSAADALALTSNGWAAWRVPGSAEAPSVLRGCDSDGVRDLDSGDIDPASVRAGGDTVTWVREGLPQSATLR